LRLTDKVALVTGGASGIGRATAELFAREGARVGVLDRDGAGAEATVAAIRGAGGQALALAADVTREAEVAGAVGRLVREFGRLDVLHNHAGVLPDGDASILDVREEVIDRALAINVKGMMLVGKHTARAMRDGGGGAIVNTASDLAIIALAGLACYVTTKTAIPGLTRSMAVDLAPHGIRVNAVAPGFTYTGMTAGMANNEALMGPMRETYLLKQLGQPLDVAQCVLFLASDEARYVTGAVLTVDGGHTVQ
jgi:NAD(P)-dependent dehydrogenase (short-subunit alcohol dehydrogenase family)